MDITNLANWSVCCSDRFFNFSVFKFLLLHEGFGIPSVSRGSHYQTNFLASKLSSCFWLHALITYCKMDIRAWSHQDQNIEMGLTFYKIDCVFEMHHLKIRPPGYLSKNKYIKTTLMRYILGHCFTSLFKLCLEWFITSVLTIFLGAKCTVKMYLTEYFHKVAWDVAKVIRKFWPK